MKLTRRTKRILLWGPLATALALILLSMLPGPYASRTYYDVRSGRILHKRSVFGVTYSATMTETDWTRFVVGLPGVESGPPVWYLLVENEYSLPCLSLHGDGYGARILRYGEGLIRLTEGREFSPEAKALAVNHFVALTENVDGSHAYGEKRVLHYLVVLEQEAETAAGAVTVEDVQRAYDRFEEWRRTGFHSEFEPSGSESEGG